jgi:hypothetical protein
MLEKLKKRIKDKVHIIFIVVMAIYLSALAVKTCMVYWEEFYTQDTHTQSTD